MKNLTFKKLRKVNLKRCEAVFHKLDDWSYSDWATALAGEVGELCNFLKKVRRRYKSPADKMILTKDEKENIKKELGDIITYADLLAARLGINLDKATVDKFNEVSDRKKWKFKL